MTQAGEEKGAREGVSLLSTPSSSAIARLCQLELLAAKKEHPPSRQADDLESTEKERCPCKGRRSFHLNLRWQEKKKAELIG